MRVCAVIDTKSTEIEFVSEKVNNNHNKNKNYMDTAWKSTKILRENVLAIIVWMPLLRTCVLFYNFKAHTNTIVGRGPLLNIL